MVLGFKCDCVVSEKWFTYVVEKVLFLDIEKRNEFDCDWIKCIVLKWILLHWLIFWEFTKYYYVICENWMFWTNVGYRFKEFSILLKSLFPKSIFERIFDSTGFDYSFEKSCAKDLLETY